MQQIDDEFAVGAPPVPPATHLGPAGWFTELVAAAGVRATRVRAWWLNCVQGALLGLLESGGVAHSKTDYTVVARAVSVIGRRLVVVTASRTWTAPPGCYGMDLFECRGGGGPGGHGNGGGGGGGQDGCFFEGWLPLNPGDVVEFDLGAGGLAGTLSGGTVSGASSGGTTTVKVNGAVVVTCPGGGGGGLGPAGPGGTNVVQATGPGDCPFNESGQNGLAVPGQFFVGGMGGGGHGYMGGLAQLVGSSGSADGNGPQSGCGGGGGGGNGLGANGAGGYAKFKY